MFDIHTEAYLRRNQSMTDRESAFPILPAAIAASLILWVAVLLHTL
ncbi:hypothetical protein PANO111632_01175 [Paracoccus nototheniae]|uniref:Uncharacterized protein n=1 Tax=Paracoccus nototheniae TaxID=2489002 RepID=A0ABW4DVL9_9RHOB|nr:hypothetical protein [Paracoccus nototheniae]